MGYAAGFYRRQHGRWPEVAELLAGNASLPKRDRWRNEFRFETGGRGLIVSCAGIDGRFGTCDDVASDPISPDW